MSPLAELLAAAAWETTWTWVVHPKQYRLISLLSWGPGRQTRRGSKRWHRAMRWRWEQEFKRAKRQ